MGRAIGLPVSLHVVSVAKRCKAAPISVNSPFVSLYCTRSLKSVHDMGSSFAPNHIGMPLVSPKLKLDFPASPGPDEPQHQRRTADLGVDGWAELPDRAPPVPLHGATPKRSRSSLKHAGHDLDPPAAEHSAEARGRFILDHDPAAAARSDGPQLTATNQPPHELSG